MTYLSIALAAVIGPLYVLREIRLARRETLAQRIAPYSMRGGNR